jgi:transcriptional regulator with XRE-family HTH domain
MTALGPRMRALRVERGLTLRQLASHASVSASLLSDIERGKVNPTVATLFSLAAALDVSAQTFFSVPDSGGPPSASSGRRSDTGEACIVRSSERATLELTGGIAWERLTPETEGGVEFMEMRYAPGACSGEGMHHHAGREYGLVLEGDLTLELGFRTHTLRAGDSVAFESTTPHRLSNRGAMVLRLAWVNIHGQR